MVRDLTRLVRRGRGALRPLALLLTACAAAAASPAPVRAGIVAEGTYTISAPERRAIPFRMVVTATGARLTPASGETVVVSYGQATAMVIDPASRTYVPLPLELVPPLLAGGLGFDASRLGTTATGKTKKILAMECAEVVVDGRDPKVALKTWRVADPAWGGEYALLERSLGLPWTAASPPPAFLGIPLAGKIAIEGKRPYRAFWEVTRLVRDDKAAEEFAVPEGYQLDLVRLLQTQGKKR
jgi:hypothetical protein